MLRFDEKMATLLRRYREKIVTNALVKSIGTSVLMATDIGEWTAWVPLLGTRNRWCGSPIIRFWRWSGLLRSAVILSCSSLDVELAGMLWCHEMIPQSHTRFC